MAAGTITERWRVPRCQGRDCGALACGGVCCEPLVPVTGAVLWCGDEKRGYVRRATLASISWVVGCGHCGGGQFSYYTT